MRKAAEKPYERDLIHFFRVEVGLLTVGVPRIYMTETGWADDRFKPTQFLAVKDAEYLIIQLRKAVRSAKALRKVTASRSADHKEGA